MHIAILEFQLKNMTKEKFVSVCDELAPKLAATPGLISKVWLADASTSTYGGVYTFKDRQAFQDFARSDFAQSLATNPNMTELKMRDFDVLEKPTRVTRGMPSAVALG
jgi:hypothetical protein